MKDKITKNFEVVSGERTPSRKISSCLIARSMEERPSNLLRVNRLGGVS